MDMEKVRKYLSRMWGGTMIGCSEVEVQYKDIVEKPDYFSDTKDFFNYQISTKAKAWEHELLPGQNDDKGPIDWKEVRAFPKIGRECFESVYLGINMNADEKSKIISVARNLNPDIKIFQMRIDTQVFRLNAKLIEQ